MLLSARIVYFTQKSRFSGLEIATYAPVAFLDADSIQWSETYIQLDAGLICEIGVFTSAS